MAGRERRETSCKNCGSIFMAVMDHGVWQKYCCRQCFLTMGPKPVIKKCQGCGSEFPARKSKSISGIQNFCNAACQKQHALDKKVQRICPNCGTMYVLMPSEAKRRDEGCCSSKCRHELHQGPRHPMYKGGYDSPPAGHAFVYLKREGYDTHYVQEHRLLAGKEIGRLIRRGEVVIHLNRQKRDNRPENLFVCESMSEYARRRNGSLPWPKESNLASLRAITMATEDNK